MLKGGVLVTYQSTYNDAASGGYRSGHFVRKRDVSAAQFDDYDIDPTIVPEVCFEPFNSYIMHVILFVVYFPFAPV